MDDLRDLVESSRKGNIKAFEKIVDMYQNMAVGYAYSILLDYHYAQDAAQEAFIQAYMNLKSLNEPQAFVSWLRKIIFSCCTRIIRKRKATLISLDDIGEIKRDDDTMDIFNKKFIREQLILAVNTLTEEQRSALFLHYLKDYSYKQISSFLGLPETTITNRIHSAKQKLKNELFSMFEDEITSLRVSATAEFKRQVIDGISKISFMPVDGRAPENIPLPSIMKACMEHLGQNDGYRAIEGTDLKLSNGYTFYMGVTGSAFRSIWNWRSRTEEGGRIDTIYMSKSPTAQINNVFEASGYDYKLLFKKDFYDSSKEGIHTFANKKAIKKSIIESIKNKEKPFLALGVVGPSEWCIITGFDEEGDVLIGWSYFQDPMDNNAELGFEPCGYFRKRDWYEDTNAVVIIENKNTKPSLKDIYTKALSFGVEEMGTINIGRTPVGLSSYSAWAKDLIDTDFSVYSPDELKQLYSVHEITCLEIAERRWYAAKFLEQVMENCPQMTPLCNAVKCFETEHDAMWKILDITGGFMNPGAGTSLANYDNRKKISDLILMAKEYDSEAILHMKEALSV